jgi:hypothetical protein
MKARGALAQEKCAAGKLARVNAWTKQQQQNLKRDPGTANGNRKQGTPRQNVSRNQDELLSAEKRTASARPDWHKNQDGNRLSSRSRTSSPAKQKPNHSDLKTSQTEKRVAQYELQNRLSHWTQTKSI